MKKYSYPQIICSCFVLLPLLFGAVASGAPLVYESFNYGGTSGAIDGKTTTALGLTGAYTTVDGYNGATNIQTSEYISTGLSFSGISTSGGALKQTVVSNEDDQKEYVYSHASLDVTAPAAGTTIYKTLLANIGVNSMDKSSASTEIRIQNSDTMVSNDNGQITVRPLSGSSTTKAAVGYDSGGFLASGGVSLNSTYLYIAKFTNVGGAGGGDATMWILDNDSFNDWQTLGGGTEGTLATYADITDTDSDADPISFSSLQSIRLATSEFSPDYNTGAAGAYTVNGELTVTYDEIRYGTSLGDVVVIPEPGTGLLVLMGLVSCLVFRRKKF